MRVVIDIPSVPYRARASDTTLNEAIHREDGKREKQYGLHNAVQKKMGPYSLGILCVGRALKEQGAHVSYLNYMHLDTWRQGSTLQLTDLVTVSRISPFLPVLRELISDLARSFQTIPTMTVDDLAQAMIRYKRWPPPAGNFPDTNMVAPLEE